MKGPADEADEQLARTSKTKVVRRKKVAASPRGEGDEVGTGKKVVKKKVVRKKKAAGASDEPSTAKKSPRVVKKPVADDEDGGEATHRIRVFLILMLMYTYVLRSAQTS